MTNIDITVEPTTEDDLVEFHKSLGPKEVKTPNMTVVAHDVAQVQRMKERITAVAPTMGTLGGSIGKPKHEKYTMRCCNDNRLPSCTDR